MKISLIGHKGYIGQNIKASLINNSHFDLCFVDRETPKVLFLNYLQSSDNIIHCAAIQRPLLNTISSFMPNFELTKFIVDNMKKSAKLVFISSIHFNSNSPFGIIRRMEEEYISLNSIFFSIYHLPYTFGPHGKENYNNAFNTFIINVSKNNEIKINEFIKDFPILLISDFVAKMISDFNQTHDVIDNFDITNITLPFFIYSLSKIHKGIEPDCKFSRDLKKVYDWYKN